jgi:uncharacterized OB-fold protein
MRFPKVTRDHAAAPFFDAAAAGVLLLQRCTGCATALGPEVRTCHTCGAVDLEPMPAAGNGHLVTWSVVRHAPTRWLVDAVPYVVATVELAEGPRVFARLLVDPDGPDAVKLGAGSALVCRFVVSGTVEDPGETLPAFVPAPGPRAGQDVDGEEGRR